MEISDADTKLYSQFLSSPHHKNRDYFALIKELVKLREKNSVRSQSYLLCQEKIDQIYDQILDEINTNNENPISPLKFGTSGWRGIIGKDLYLKSISIVTHAIVLMYKETDNSVTLSAELGVKNLEDAKKRGCVVGFDNRFGNVLLAQQAIKILTSNGFLVHYAGESTTGTLSTSVLELNAAFSINLTPSHNPLEYGGFKFNAADAGPASPTVTNWITSKANELLENFKPQIVSTNHELLSCFDSLDSWFSLVNKGAKKHGLNYEKIISKFHKQNKLAVVVDCVHGASRVHIKRFFKNTNNDNLHFLRIREDPTFGGISPEPSSDNLQNTKELLNSLPNQLKLGVILDPDADRIRFTDGHIDITMNHFGAMAYHFLHEIKEKKGIVAKTVATSNFANKLAESFDENLFETKVGFKEFKPVIDHALVCFEESDGITVVGHTPEKDAYIGLLLALDMVMTLQQNLGDYLDDLQNKYGTFIPDKDGVTVTQKGSALTNTLEKLKVYNVGNTLAVGDEKKKIIKTIDIDGYKMILEDGSWIMIRPSGTEPKVRFYVEATTESQKDKLFETAKTLLQELGLN